MGTYNGRVLVIAGSDSCGGAWVIPLHIIMNPSVSLADMTLIRGLEADVKLKIDQRIHAWALGLL